MLRHAHAEAALESSRSRVRRYTLIPTEGLGAFFQDFDRGEAVVGIARVTRLRTGDVHEAELYRIKVQLIRHFVHHAFPGPLGFLLVIAARRAGARGVGAVRAP